MSLQSIYWKRWDQSIGGNLPRKDADLCGIAELGKEVFVVFPGEAECAHVGDADPRHDVANSRKVSWVESSVHECRFGSGYEISKW